MNLKYIYPVIFALVVLLNCFVYADESETVKPALSLETLPRMVKGFPMVLKLTATGKQTVAQMSIFNDKAQIEVVFKTKPPVKESKYVIRSSQEEEVIEASREGDRRDPSYRFRMYVDEGKEVTFLLDLSSLRPVNLNKNIIVDDVPPGKYSIVVSFPFSGMTSNSFDVELIEPSLNEKLFLDKVYKNKTKIWQKWNRILWENDDVSGLDQSLLGEVAKLQLAFHILLSKVLSYKEPLDKDLVESIERSDVPNNLQPEKTFLAWEVAKSIDISFLSPEKEKAFFDENPGLKWRADEVNSGNKSFLRYRKSKPKEDKPQ